MSYVSKEARESDMAKKREPDGWKATAPMVELDGPSSGRYSHHDNCRDTWGRNYVMREYCDKQQNAARRRGGY